MLAISKEETAELFSVDCGDDPTVQVPSLSAEPVQPIASCFGRAFFIFISRQGSWCSFVTVGLAL